MKRISAGYYIEIYKNVTIEVIKTLDVNNKIVWYHLINGIGGNDYHTYKNVALVSAKYMIDNPNEYVK